MSSSILNNNLSNEIEKRLNSLITNHLKIKEPHLNDSESKKERSQKISSFMDRAVYANSVVTMGIGSFMFLMLGEQGAQAINANPELVEYAVLAKTVGLAALIGTIGFSVNAVVKLTDAIENKINTKLGITTYSMTEKNLKEIEQVLGVKLKNEDFIKIAKSLDQSDIKETIQKAAANVKVKNK